MDIRDLPGTENIFIRAQSLSHVRLFANTWTVAHQAPLSMELSRQEYWRGLPFLPTRDQNCVSGIGGFFNIESPGICHLLILWGGV